MKTISLDEAFKLATKGPLRPDVDLDVTFHIDGREENVIEVTNEDHSQTAFYAVNPIHAALLAHCFNTYMELVEALRTLEDAMCRHQNDPDSNENWDEFLAGSMNALAKASTVEVGE